MLFSCENSDLLGGVFEKNKIRESHFFFIKNMDKKHRKKFADVKNTLKRIFPMKVMFPEIMYKQVT